jgi:hypothetical protein
MNAVVCAPKWSKWFFLLSVGCSTLTPAPPQSSFVIQPCSPDPVQRQPLTLTLENQRWELRHLPQGRSIKGAKNNWQDSQTLYPFGDKSLLFEVTIENTGDVPLQVVDQPLQLSGPQGTFNNIPKAQLLQNWPAPSGTHAAAVQARSLALTDILAQALSARTILPGRKTTGIVAFEDGPQTLQEIRLNQPDSPVLSVCKQGLELLGQKMASPSPAPILP